jgi:putative DNA primase/helicase
MIVETERPPDKPEIIKPDLAGIPEALKSERRWMNWKLEFRAGQRKPWTKVPVDPHTGGSGDSTDPNKWGTLADAVARDESHIGFALGDGFVGVDLDGCISPDGKIEPAALKVRDRLNTYGEHSISGTGIHFIARGSLPLKGRRKGSIEMYDSGRFFTMSGAVLAGSSATIDDRTAELAAFHAEVFPPPKPKAPGNNGHHVPHDDEIIQRALNANNGDKFKRLFGGDTSEYGHDDSSADLALCNLIAFWTGPEPAAIDRLFRQSGLYRDKWEREDYRTETINRALESRTEFYKWNGNGQAKSRKAKTPRPEGKGDPLSIFHPEGQTDLANARRFVQMHGDKIRFCRPWRKWIIWNGKQWKSDDTGHIERLAKGVPDQIFRAALAFDDMEALRFGVRSASARGITAMLSLAESESGIPVLPDEFDRDNWLLNCDNGVLNLRTGELGAHDSALLLSKLCPTAFVPDATNYEFEKCLEGIFNGQSALIDFLRRMMGVCLTGTTTEQVIPILFGDGSNGKTLLLMLFVSVLGSDYAMTANRELLMVKRGETHPTELAGLFGKRLVVSIETDDGHQLAEGLVKQLTGSDRIRARRMREDFWEFEPTHKVLLATNYKPRIKGDDHAIWRRIALLPFQVRFWNEDKGESGKPELKADKKLEEKLAREREGVLAWMVSGCLEWQRTGLKIPAEVQKATADYRSAEDVLTGFLAEKCITMPGCKVKAGDAYKSFRRYCKDTGETEINQRRFGQAMTTRGFERATNNGVWYCDVGLTAEAQNECTERTEP